MTNSDRTQTPSDFSVGDVVEFSWGFIDVLGTVAELYGEGPSAHVVVLATPELTGEVVGKPTTISLPVAEVRRLHDAA
jgi:hypothetical protein